MSRARFVPILGLLALASVLAAGPSFGRGLDVEIWTDRGGDAVYKPGDVLQISAKTSDDAYLLVYEIDTEGYVRVLYPFRGSSGAVEGRKTNKIPSDNSGLELVVEESTGLGYIVAVASREPLQKLPWYLRPYDEQADAMGYQDTSAVLDQMPKDVNEEGVTSDGQIVGDPFVAMERIRRELFEQPDDTDGFATSYTTYYVHERVKYPRYLCNDCHRPGQYSWWDGWDPYYATCSAFTFRVNWNWYWGAPYWCGYVPYYVYTYLPTCPPKYYVGGTVYYSSWDGWSKWNAMWGGPLTRTKTPPPAGYQPPSKYRDGGAVPNRTPPGFLAGGDGLRDRVVRPTPVSSRREGGRGNQVLERSRTLAGSAGRMLDGRRASDRRPARDVVNPERFERRSRDTGERGGPVVRGRGEGFGRAEGSDRNGTGEGRVLRPAPQRESSPPPSKDAPPSRGSDAPRVESGRGNNSPPAQPAPQSNPGRSSGGGGAGSSGGGRGGFGSGGRR